MKVLTLFLRYGTSKYAEAEEQLAELFYRNLPEVDREILVIDNSVPVGQILEKAPGRTVIGGDNSSWEFSGWDVGVRWFGNTLRNFDLVHLVTSAFRMSYADYLDRFRLSALELAVDRPIVLGHIDCYNEPVQAFGYPFQHWIRSSCLFLAPAELIALRSLVSVSSANSIFSDSPAEPFLKDAPLSIQYRQNILNWLVGEGTGQGTTWHSRFALTDETLPFFKQKALAIINEQLLSARLRAQGAMLVDITWLYGKVADSAPVDVHRPWYEQLRDRYVDAISLALPQAA